MMILPVVIVKVLIRYFRTVGRHQLRTNARLWRRSLLPGGPGKNRACCGDVDVHFLVWRHSGQPNGDLPFCSSPGRGFCVPTPAISISTKPVPLKRLVTKCCPYLLGTEKLQRPRWNKQCGNTGSMPPMNTGCSRAWCLSVPLRNAVPFIPGRNS